MMPFLEHVANWTAHLSLPSNHLRMPPNSTVPAAGGTDHIFVNGNLARVLLSTYRLQASAQKEPEYLRQGLAWCDTLVELQAPIVSSRGNPAGYWGVGYGLAPNCSYPPTAALSGYCAHSGDIYFGDTGTAVTTLALCHKLSPDDAQRARYLGSMQRFATFVLEGSKTAPVHKKGIVDSFVDGESGAVGCGYYKCLNRTSDNCANVPGHPSDPSDLNCPSRSPYVIATGTTGAAFFAELYGITRNETYAAVATKALAFARTLVMSTGEIPYVLDGANCSTLGCRSVATGKSIPLGGPGYVGTWPYDTISYVTEGVLSVALNIPAQKATLVKQWKPTVDFLLATQDKDGAWGEGRPSDVMRSPRVMSLLSWWLSAVETPAYKDKPTQEAVARYLAFLRRAGFGPGSYGVCDNTVTTGMAGLAAADAMQFGVSY